MPFTDDERRRWHEEKRARAPEPARWAPQAAAICVSCQNPFGYSEGVITEEATLCDICLGD
ncbi:MAG TPA: hypothetical protein VE053_12155 [Allosphingosinicella sp.]|nr:hypothetical protein [Allosphingosinicella sp.]